jgi:hypothetical protein
MKNYGELCDFATNETIRRATAAEAEQSSTMSNDEGVIVVDGRACYVIGPAVIAGKIILRDKSGVGHDWSTISETLPASIADELREAMHDDSSGRTVLVPDGETIIGGVGYRWL